MRRGDLAVVAALFLAALALRAHGAGNPPFRWMDERTHVPAAVHYWERGQFEPDFWQHPPLRHLLAYGFLAALGDDPWGWRARNVLLGAAAAALTWLFAFHATGSRGAALLAGALLATDPLHVVVSRFTFDEVYGGAFFVAAAAVLVARGARPAAMSLSALLLGCALATKWYYAPGWLVLAALAVRERGPREDPAGALLALTTFTAVPLGVYVASYWPWFGRGYGLSELAELTVSAYHSLQSMTEEYVRVTDTRTIFLHHLSAAEWFTRPILTGAGTLLGEDRGEFILYGNDLPVWGLTLPAVVAAGVLAVRRRSLREGLPALLFAASYALFALVRRPAFLYSAVPLLPFAFTAIAQGASELSRRLGPRGPRVLWAAGALLVAWNLYLYPLVTANPVPLAPYRFVLDRAEVELH